MLLVITIQRFGWDEMTTFTPQYTFTLIIALSGFSQLIVGLIFQIIPIMLLGSFMLGVSVMTSITRLKPNLVLENEYFRYEIDSLGSCISGTVEQKREIPE